MSEEEAAQLAKKMINAEFDFNDFLKQAQMMKGMGSMGGVANMIPGMAGKITPQQLNQAEVSLSVVEPAPPHAVDRTNFRAPVLRQVHGSRIPQRLMER